MSQKRHPLRPPKAHKNQHILKNNYLWNNTNNINISGRLHNEYQYWNHNIEFLFSFGLALFAALFPSGPGGRTKPEWHPRSCDWTPKDNNAKLGRTIPPTTYMQVLIKHRNAFRSQTPHRRLREPGPQARSTPPKKKRISTEINSALRQEFLGGNRISTEINY